MVHTYKKMLLERRLNPSLFLLEIVEKLYDKMPEELPYGITELFDSIPHPKPTFSNFRSKISDLQSSGCVLVHPSKEKASKKNVFLTEDFRKQLEKEIYL